jgi:lysophospholipase L1-like esterase
MRYRLWTVCALLCAAMPAMAAPITAADAHVARMGRTEVNTDGSVRFGYPGVSFYLAFEGSRLTMEADATANRNFIDVIVDGGEPRKINLPNRKQAVTLFEADTPGLHRVEIVHRSETWHGIATLRSFDTDGEWKVAPELPRRKLLVLGDSISCGEAIDRVPGTMKAPSWWNPRESYGMVMARELKSQVQLVCYGGRGLVRSFDNRSDLLNLPDYYQLAIADQQAPVPWDQKEYQADVVVVGIGINDMARGIPEQELYVNAYVKLVQTLLKDHPHAQIMLIDDWMRGPKKKVLTNYIAETVRRVADPRVHAVASIGYGGDKTDGHPTKEQAVKMSNDLLPKIRAVMRW